MPYLWLNLFGCSLVMLIAIFIQTLTTKKEYVNKWIESKNAFVILTTYHSSHVVKHLKFDFKILDECHHVCQTHYDSKFYKILQIESNSFFDQNFHFTFHF